MYFGDGFFLVTCRARLVLDPPIAYSAEMEVRRFRARRPDARERSERHRRRKRDEDDKADNNKSVRRVDFKKR